MTFSQRSQFIYTALTDCHCLFIRKQNWIELLNENSEISSKLIMRIFETYTTEIKSKVLVAKRKAFEDLKVRMGNNLIQTSKAQAFNVNYLMKNTKERFGYDSE